MAGPFFFAWVGGTIGDRLALETTGNTHGALLESFGLVGDVNAGSQLLIHAQAATGLEAGAFYKITGPGIAGGTFFAFDGTSTLYLSEAATATLTGVTFIITRLAPVGEIVATLSAGSSTISGLAGADLVAGQLYAVAGPGIGYVNAPVPLRPGTIGSLPQVRTGVASAFFVYGGGDTADLQALFPTTDFGVTSQWGQLVTTEVGAVDTLSVNADLSGTVTIAIFGNPVQPPTLVDHIPALSSLTPGLRYNVSGPGIAAGATFVAPSGGDAIELDLPASSSGVLVPLLITGPRVPNEAFDPVRHAREDEDIFSVAIEQNEGDFATLAIEIRNPRIGLLAPGRNLWCWLSWDSNWSPEGGKAPNLVPLFNGRLVGIPARQSDQIVRLTFLARPDDYNDQKLALAATMQVLPFWDPVWLAARQNDPDTVLEAYSKLWHTDRTSLAVTASDIITGEDGTVTLTEDQHFYEEMHLAYGQPPLSYLTVTGTVSWTQEGDGTIDLTDRICGAFGAAGSRYGAPLISCLCGDGLKSDWPKPGAAIGGGWSLSAGNDISGLPLNYIVDAVKSNNGGWLLPLYYNVVLADQSSAAIQSAAGSTTPSSSVMFAGYDTFTVQFPISVYRIRFNVDYRASRKRTETATAVLTADIQQVLSDPAGGDEETLSLTSQYPGEGVDPGGGIPIGDLRRNSYFQTDRGTASFEYMLALARAKMRARARCVDLSLGTDWARAIAITLRNSVTLFDRRLPGGSATGKVKSYRLSAGDSGMFGSFTLGCSIGRGATVSAAAGINGWADPGYCGDGYQVAAGGQSDLIPGELAYQGFDQFVVADDGVDLFQLDADSAVNALFVSNGFSTQTNALQPFQNAVSPGSPIAVMRALTTTVTLDLKPVAGGAFHSDFFPAVTPLAVPKGIDLEAPAG